MAERGELLGWMLVLAVAHLGFADGLSLGASWAPVGEDYDWDFQPAAQRPTGAEVPC